MSAPEDQDYVYEREFYHAEAKAAILAEIPSGLQKLELTRNEYDDEGEIEGHARMESYTQGKGPEYRMVALHEWTRDPKNPSFQIVSVTVCVGDNYEKFHPGKNPKEVLEQLVLRLRTLQWALAPCEQGAKTA